MARAGFVHTPSDNSPDIAMCFFCLKELEGWEPDDDPQWVLCSCICLCIYVEKTPSAAWKLKMYIEKSRNVWTFVYYLMLEVLLLSGNSSRHLQVTFASQSSFNDNLLSFVGSYIKHLFIYLFFCVVFFFWQEGAQISRTFLQLHLFNQKCWGPDYGRILQTPKGERQNYHRMFEWGSMTS